MKLHTTSSTTALFIHKGMVFNGPVNQTQKCDSIKPKYGGLVGPGLTARRYGASSAAGMSMKMGGGSQDLVLG